MTRPLWLNWAFIDKALTAVEDYHVPACIFIFIVGTFLQLYGKMNATFVGFSGTVIGGILGHKAADAFSGRKAGDEAPPSA